MTDHHPSTWRAWLADDSWLPFVLPLAVFLLVGSLEPTADTPGGTMIGLAIPYSAYPVVYTVKIVLTLAAILLAWPVYRRTPVRLTLLAVLVGLAGGVVWIVLARLRWEARLLSLVGAERLLDLGARSGFNPWAQIASPAWAGTFLAVRLFGLVLVIAVAEEFFLRGYVMRVVMDDAWHRVPIGRVNRTAAIVGTALPLLMHPGELLAAAVWFSLITWLLTRTRSIWDCVLAHATTNAVLGAYVLASGHWELM